MVVNRWTTFLLVPFFGLFSVHSEQKESILVIIEKVQHSPEKLESATVRPEDLPFHLPGDAKQLPDTARGEMPEKTPLNSIPVVLFDGRQIPADSLREVEFEKIDVLSGVQATSLYGLYGGKGVWIVQGQKEQKNGRNQGKEKVQTGEKKCSREE